MLPRSVHTSQKRMFFVTLKVGITTHELSDELHDDAADDFYAFYGFGRIIEICLIVIRICPSIRSFWSFFFSKRPFLTIISKWKGVVFPIFTQKRLNVLTSRYFKKKKKRHRRRVLLGNAACLMCVGEILISKEDLIKISRHCRKTITFMKNEHLSFLQEQKRCKIVRCFKKWLYTKISLFLG